jgi:hypothetical protein
MSTGELLYPPGLRVHVNLEGETIAGIVFESEVWVPAEVLGAADDGTSVAVEFVSPIGDPQRRGLFARPTRPQTSFVIHDPDRVRLVVDEDVPSGDYEYDTLSTT